LPPKPDNLLLRWTDLQKRHIEWLALPKSQRQPPTKTEWADILGRTRRTLQRWERLPGFQDAVWARAQARLSDSLPDIMEALIGKASGGNTAAARLLFESAGRIVQRQQHETSGHLIHFTADTFARALAELAQWEEQSGIPATIP
jgi:hypothetical protein